MDIKKYEEQKSKIKTVSIRVIYEWINNFFKKIESQLKDNKFSDCFKEDIAREKGKYDILYLKYVSLRRRHALRILEVRKELCNKLLEIVDDKGFIINLKTDMEHLCMDNDCNFFETLDDLKASDNIKKLENNLNLLTLVNKETDDKEYQEFMGCVNSVLKLINDYKDHSQKNIKKDLEKIKKEKSVTSLISAVVTNKNKINHEKEALTSVILNYATNVTTFVRFYLNSYRTFLKKYNLDPETGNYVRALAKMLKCWDDDYSATKIQNDKVNKKYCKELFEKLKSIAKKEQIGQMYELSVLFTQLMSRLKVILESYISHINDKKRPAKFVDGWVGEFNKSFGKIKNKEKFLNEENIKKLYKSVQSLLMEYNNKKGMYNKFIDEFNTVALSLE